MEKWLIWILDKDKEHVANNSKLEEENRELRCDLEILKFDASYD